VRAVDILQVGEPVLRRKARALSRDEILSGETRELIANMRAAMYAGPGVGLAAPQIGVSVQAAVIEDRAEYQKEISAEQLAQRERRPVAFHVIINPVIVHGRVAESSNMPGGMLAGRSGGRLGDTRVDAPEMPGDGSGDTSIETSIDTSIDTRVEAPVEFYEGCLSLAGFVALVPRSRTVRVECLDENATPRVIHASGWYARILQHEIDHLNGTLYIDRMCSRTFTSMGNWSRFWKDKAVEDVHAALTPQP
jgi:peptide deformylase